MEDNIYLIYITKTGDFEGFYIDSSIDDYNLEENCSYICISKEIHEYLLYRLPNIKVNIELIKNIDLLDSKDFFIEFEPEVDIDLMKRNLIHKMKSSCEKKITAGLMIALSNGNIKEFTYKIEDQINLKEMIDNYTFGDTIFYHAKEETVDLLYDYEDIVLIHKMLYNNKIYNLIYTTVLCDYIQKEYNSSMYKQKILIDYGFSTQEIIDKVDSLYEKQRIL